MLRMRMGERAAAAVRARFPVRRRATWLALMTAIAFGVVAISSQVDFADSDQPRLAQASLTVSPTVIITPVPRSYFGVSTEYWSFPLFARRLALFERVLSLLRVGGNGPLVVRVGGDSADHAFWNPRRHRLPAWAFTLSPEWLHVAGALVKRLDARLIMDLNLITDSPATAARWARAAEAGLPRRSILGFEVGNEPDLYNHAFWRTMTAGGSLGDHLLPAALTAGDYITDFRAYAKALQSAAPHVPLLGPAVANPHANVDWVRNLLASHPPQLGTVSVHRYPYSACSPPRAATYPTVARLLSQRATTGMAGSLAPAITLARRAGLPIRLTELNSITCGGRPGVSDTFAAALWAPEALLRLMQAGVDGVNLHIRANTINAPFALGPASGLHARPLLYGLIMFARTLGPQARLVGLKLKSSRSTRLSAWALRVGPGGLHVLLVNRGDRGIRLRLRMPTGGPASIERLLAPSAAARSGVTLDGQRLDRNGSWVGSRANETVKPVRGGEYWVRIPRLSATLIGAPLSATPIGAQIEATLNGAHPSAPAATGYLEPSDHRAAPLPRSHKPKG